MLIGESGLERLSGACVAVIGAGGVGGYAAEMIARAGVGHMVVMDSDCVSVTNKNRQLLALDSTVGRPKCDVMRERLLDINPQLDITVIKEYLEADSPEAVLGGYRIDFLVDAIDSLSPKVFLLYHAFQRQIPLISSMGAGAKIDPTQIGIADISKTTQCALARAVRKRLRGLGIQKGIPVVYSKEPAREEAVIEVDNEQCKRTTTGTVSYMPALFGCHLAAYVINHL